MLTFAQFKEKVLAESSLNEGLSKEQLLAIKKHYSNHDNIMADIGDYEYYKKHNDNKSAESIAKKLKSIAIDDKVILDESSLNEGFSKPKGFVQISKDEHDVILKNRLDHEKEHGTKNFREALSKRDTLTNTTSTFVSNGGGQVSHGFPEIVKIEDAKKGTTKYYRQPAGGHVKEDLDEAHKIGNKVTIHKGTGAGITGHIGEISRKFKGDTDPTYTIFHGDNEAITASKKQIKAVKEDLDGDIYTRIILAPDKEDSNYDDVFRATRKMGSDIDYIRYEISKPYGSRRGHMTSMDFNNTKEEVQKFLDKNKLKASVIQRVNEKGKQVFESVDEKFAHPNHKKLDANGSGELDAEDFKLLRAKKKTAAGTLTKEENEVLESLLAKLDEKCAMKPVKEDDAEDDTEEDDDEECDEACDSKAKK